MAKGGEKKEKTEKSSKAEGGEKKKPKKAENAKDAPKGTISSFFAPRKTPPPQSATPTAATTQSSKKTPFVVDDDDDDDFERPAARKASPKPPTAAKPTAKLPTPSQATPTAVTAPEPPKQTPTVDVPMMDVSLGCTSEQKVELPKGFLTLDDRAAAKRREKLMKATGGKLLATAQTTETTAATSTATAITIRDDGDDDAATKKGKSQSHWDDVIRRTEPQPPPKMTAPTMGTPAGAVLLSGSSASTAAKRQLEPDDSRENSHDGSITEPSQSPDAQQAAKRKKKSESPSKARKPKLDITPAKPLTPMADPLLTEPSQETTVEKPKKKWNYRDIPDRSALHPHSKDIPKGNANCLAGLTFTVTGQLESLDREEVTQLIRDYGGVVQLNAGKKVTHVVLGQGGGESKSKAILERHLTAVTEDELFEMIRTLPAKPASMVKAVSPKKPKKVPDVPPLPMVIQPPAASAAAPATTSPRPSAASTLTSNPMSGMWVDKYQPRAMAELVVSNKQPFDRLVKWLRTWAASGKPPQEGKGDGFRRAVLISGPPGIGKSTSARLACNEAGFTVIEFNASDTRSKKSMKEVVMEALHTTTITSFMKPAANSPTSVPKLQALVMDEVDGMSAGDRGGNAELIALIKTARVPVICICNDRSNSKVRTLANHCLDLRFPKPLPEQVATRLCGIATAEGFTLPADVARRIATASNCDLRQAVHMLQMYSVGSRDGSMQGAEPSKDIDLDPFDAVPTLFTFNTTGMEQKLRCYFADSNMVPLLVQESYLDARPSALMKPGHPPHIDLVSRAADDISASDVLSKTMRFNGRWELSSEFAVMSCVLPCYSVQGMLPHRPAFPTWLAKNSTQTKNRRLATDLQIHMRMTAAGATQSEVILDYLPSLSRRLHDPLASSGIDAIDDVLDLMKEYGITKDDWVAVTDPTDLCFRRRDIPKIDPKVSAAFTKK